MNPEKKTPVRTPIDDMPRRADIRRDVCALLGSWSTGDMAQAEPSLQELAILLVLTIDEHLLHGTSPLNDAPTYSGSMADAGAALGEQIIPTAVLEADAKRSGEAYEATRKEWAKNRDGAGEAPAALVALRANPDGSAKKATPLDALVQLEVAAHCYNCACDLGPDYLQDVPRTVCWCCGVPGPAGAAPPVAPPPVVVAPVVEAPPAPPVVEAQAQICWNCSQPVAAGVKTCGACGAAQNVPAAPPTQQDVTNGK